ncbi:hypothetical protein RHGRI_013042 [Rhododendron griersonianum]|uniref:Protein kinase domain-containing protein n=1 Tax=Rhododendron griersonianum TaxID=479676 RepID=A0AAV6K444_9ERIC|nr:hypothetical protein RHGRI_013042 [Rhododendron griersonianum]
MNKQEKGSRKEGLNVDQKVVIVAVKASKEIPRDTLVWALTHVAQPGVCIKLLVVIPDESSSNLSSYNYKLWGFRRFTSECAGGLLKNLPGTMSDKKDYITDSCIRLMRQLRDVYDSDKTKVRVKIVSASHCGVVASEAKRAHTSWIIFDKRLTEEVEPCMEQLDCNVVVIKRSGPKVLRLNLVGSPKTQSDVAILRPVSVAAAERVNDNYDPWNVIKVPKLTPASSPEQTLFTTTDVGASSLSSLDPATSPYFFSGMNWDIKQNFLFNDENPSLDEFDPDKEREELSSPSTSLCSHSWIADIVSSASEFPNPLAKHSQRPNAKAPTSFMSDALVGLELDRDLEIRTLSYRLDLNRRYNQDPLEWSARQKIAVGAARGLRYLHEECRVGCIVHRDLRPNNILLTHDFEPLVGDFGLARWQPDGDLGVETRVMGTFGYLAPEYPQTGQITEKADVYSFGVVLVELVTGRKAMDVNRPKGQQCLTEWARPLLEKNEIHEMIDPHLRNCYSEKEVQSMLRCASLCIRRDPDLRPRMCQGVSIGPFCTVGSSAKLGNACQLYPGSHIFGNTELGDQCILMTGAVVGDDLPGRTVIGCNNVIGHHCVVGIKCQDMKYKVIGDNNLVMGSCHIAHDCKVGSNNILANNTLLAGHVVVEDYAHTAGATVVHQFCHIGSFSFIGGGSVIRSLRIAYRKIFMPTDVNSGGIENRLTEVEQNEELAYVPAVCSMVQSIRDSFAEDRRGICSFTAGNHHKPNVMPDCTPFQQVAVANYCNQSI